MSPRALAPDPPAILWPSPAPPRASAEAVANGSAPVTESLAEAPLERVLVVVPHEDFHESREARRAPPPLDEAAATLAGFLTAAEFARQRYGEASETYQKLAREPDLFLRKAEIVNRYRREGIAFKQIYPEAHFSLYDFVRLTTMNILSDLWHAARERVFWKNISSISRFRYMQFHGTRMGYRESGLLTPQLRETFYYARGRRQNMEVQRDIEPIRYNES